MMRTHNAEDRWTKHANGIHVAMPHIRTSVLYEFYQHAVQQHTAYHDIASPVMKGLCLCLWKYLEDPERIRSVWWFYRLASVLAFSLGTLILLTDKHAGHLTCKTCSNYLNGSLLRNMIQPGETPKQTPVFFSRTTWVSRHQKGAIPDFNEARDDKVALASAGPYANQLHLAPDRQPHQHLITQIFFTRQMLILTPNQQCQSSAGNKNS